MITDSFCTVQYLVKVVFLSLFLSGLVSIILGSLLTRVIVKGFECSFFLFSTISW